MFFNNTNTGFILQTMLYLANQSDPTANNSLENLYISPIGADNGKFYYNDIISHF